MKGGEGGGGRKPLVVRDDMDMADMTSLMNELLERMSEHERELRRFRSEKGLPKTDRVGVGPFLACWFGWFGFLVWVGWVGGWAWR